jgi:hypothetical protein
LALRIGEYQYLGDITDSKKPWDVGWRAEQSGVSETVQLKAVATVDRQADALKGY